MQVGQLGQTTLTVVNIEEATCATAYNSLLISDPDLARRTAEALTEGQQAKDVMVQGQPLSSVLRPRFISESRKQELARVSRITAGLLERAGTILIASDRLLDAIGATEQERDVWSVDPGYPGFTVTSRLDSFMVGARPRFIEYNAESPAGIAFGDVLAEIFRELPSMREWPPAASMGTFEGRAELLRSLLWAYRTWGGTRTPFVAVADWEGVLTRRDFELCADYFREHGVPTAIVDPRRLEYRQGKLWHGDQKVDLVYRRVLLHELLEKADEARDLLQAYRDGAVCIVNSPRSKLLHKKALFALLGDEQLGLELSREEQEVVEQCIPWTRLMTPGETTYGGQRVNLARFVVQQQDRLALKPIDDYGGHGVVLGWDVSPQEWERAVEAAMDQQFVVQERVPVAQGEFPVERDGEVTIEPLLVDTDPLMFRGEMGGILTRMSASPLLNVSAGTGSVAPTFVVPEQGG